MTDSNSTTTTNDSNQPDLGTTGGIPVMNTTPEFASVPESAAAQNAAIPVDTIVPQAAMTAPAGAAVSAGAAALAGAAVPTDAAVPPVAAALAGAATPAVAAPAGALAAKTPLKALHVWLVIILLGLILAVSTANLITQLMPIWFSGRGGVTSFVPNDSFISGNNGQSGRQSA